MKGNTYFIRIHNWGVDLRNSISKYNSENVWEEPRRYSTIFSKVEGRENGFNKTQNPNEKFKTLYFETSDGENCIKKKKKGFNKR